MLRASDKKLHVSRSVPRDVFRSSFVPLLDDRGAGVISTYSNWGLAGALAGPAAGAAWPSANAAIFIPVRIPVPVVVDRLVVATGTGTGGNYDVGIYDEDGVLVVSTGSTARPGAGQESIVDITDTTLMPGLYYLALSVDGTNTMVGTSYNNAGQAKLYGMRQMAAAFPLPSNATFDTQTLVAIPQIAAYLKPAERVKPWHGSMRFPPLNVITPFHVESQGTLWRTAGATGNTFGSVALGANQVYYHPFTLYETATAMSMSYIVGGVQNGNADLGIYDANLNRLVNTGSTAQGTANILQNIDITDTKLGPGLYYMAIQLSSGTGTVLRQVVVDELLLPILPRYEQAPGSFGLPTTATPVVSTSTSPVGVAMGVHFNALV